MCLFGARRMNGKKALVVAGDGGGGDTFCVRCALTDDVRERCTDVYMLVAGQNEIQRRMCCARAHANPSLQSRRPYFANGRRRCAIDVFDYVTRITHTHPAQEDNKIKFNERNSNEVIYGFICVGSARVPSLLHCRTRISVAMPLSPEPRNAPKSMQITTVNIHHSPLNIQRRRLTGIRMTWRFMFRTLSPTRGIFRHLLRFSLLVNRRECYQRTNCTPSIAIIHPEKNGDPAHFAVPGIGNPMDRFFPSSSSPFDVFFYGIIHPPKTNVTSSSSCSSSASSSSSFTLTS